MRIRAQQSFANKALHRFHFRVLRTLAALKPTNGQKYMCSEPLPLTHKTLSFLFMGSVLPVLSGRKLVRLSCLVFFSLAVS